MGSNSFFFSSKRALYALPSKTEIVAAFYTESAASDSRCFHLSSQRLIYFGQLGCWAHRIESQSNNKTLINKLATDILGSASAVCSTLLNLSFDEQELQIIHYKECITFRAERDIKDDEDEELVLVEDLQC
ncbi:hypothetical protein FF1_031005 [Malus domestica]